MERYDYMQDSPTLYQGNRYKDLFSLRKITPPPAVSVFPVTEALAKRPDILVAASGLQQSDAWLLWWLNGIPCSFGVVEGMQIMVPA